MGWFDGFPFQTKADMEKEKRDFERRVFPFGLEQRDYARGVLVELIPHIKSDTELLFAFINSKDIYMLNEQTDEALAHARRQMKKLRHLTEEDKDKILMLVVLDSVAPGLDAYPTAQDVLSRL